ncbi:hypothetical protein [Cellulomonas sp. URHB0016]
MTTDDSTPRTGPDPRPDDETAVLPQVGVTSDAPPVADAAVEPALVVDAAADPALVADAAADPVLVADAAADPVVDDTVVGGTGPAGPRPRLRVSTVVWGLVVATVGVGVLAWASGFSIDLQLSVIVLLAAAGTALLVGSILSGARSSRR